jgi:hypothetical protein
MEEAKVLNFARFGHEDRVHVSFLVVIILTIAGDTA